jgi:hypothetical protein
MSASLTHPVLSRPAYVVFSDATRLWPLKFLRQGFRHCLVMLPVKGGYVSLDPLCGQIEVRFHPETDITYLRDALRRMGHRVLSLPAPLTVLCPPRLKPYIGFLTCVGVVKRALGLFAPTIHTPYQLYRYLERNYA